MPPLDIQKLAQNIARANKLTATAGAESDRGAGILDDFEKHLANAKGYFDQVKAYDEQLAAMQQTMGNAGPPLDPTFPVAPAAVTSGSSFHHDTGDPLK